MTPRIHFLLIISCHSKLQVRSVDSNSVAGYRFWCYARFLLATALRLQCRGLSPLSARRARQLTEPKPKFA